MKNSLLTRLFAGALIATITLTAYGKTTPVNNTIQPVFNTAPGAAKTTAAIIYTELLNNNLHVTYAVDNGVDITGSMSAWTFLFNGDYPGGDAQGWNDILGVTGSWDMPEESGTISIMFPPTVSQLVFMSRTWTISNNAIARNGDIVLIAADGDEVHLRGNFR